jgi:annexin A6
VSSDTKNVDIYFTTNGSKPDPFQPHSMNGKYTIKYKKTFRLPEGKRTVKAIAVTK